MADYYCKKCHRRISNNKKIVLIQCKCGEEMVEEYNPQIYLDDLKQEAIEKDNEKKV